MIRIDPCFASGGLIGVYAETCSRKYTMTTSMGASYLSNRFLKLLVTPRVKCLHGAKIVSVVHQPTRSPLADM